MFLDGLLFALVDYGCQNVGEDAELVKVSHLKPHFEGMLYLHLIHLKDDGHSLQRVGEELRQVVVKVIVHEDKVLLEVVGQMIEVEEDLLEVLFDESQDSYELDVAKSGHVIIGNGVILVTNQEWELNIKPLHERLGFVVLGGGQLYLPVSQDSLD